MQREDIKTMAQGRWRGILAGLGFDRRILSGKRGPCPICSRGEFRVDDKDGRGTFICSRCGAGNGVDLVMKAKGVDFLTAKGMIEGQIGAAPIEAPKVRRDEADSKREMTALWLRARPLDGQDVASRYLRSRGLEVGGWAASLRCLSDLAYSEKGEPTRYLPAMLAKFVAPDGKSAILHRTYLAEPGVKADVRTVRKMFAGTVPQGGAVRLEAAEEEMGIAEGIETARAAAVKFDMPVWAATSANLLMKWEPPEVVRRLVIFGDNDPGFTGQMASYNLAFKVATLRRDTPIEVEVRLPKYFDAGVKLDFNDGMREAA